jgi:hypothetical protein
MNKNLKYSTYKIISIIQLGNTFDVIKYNEDYEIWDTLVNKTKTNMYSLNPSVTLSNGQIVNIPMKVISIEETKRDGPNRFGTSKK